MDMARKYAAPLLRAISMNVVRTVVNDCPRCSSGAHEFLCPSCNAEFVKTMDRAALEGSREFLSRYYEMALERIPLHCKTCYGDGKIHEPWGMKNNWSGVVLCADASTGLRLGEVVIPGRDIMIVDKDTGFYTIQESRKAKWHYAFDQAVGVSRSARIDLGAHPDDGERWDAGLADFEAIVFFHIDQIIATADDDNRPKAVAPFHANHAAPQDGFTGMRCRKGVVIVDVGGEHLTEDVMDGNLIVASRNTLMKARKRMYLVLASGVDGVEPGNSVVVMDRFVVESESFTCNGRLVASIESHDIICKGEIVR